MLSQYKLVKMKMYPKQLSDKVFLNMISGKMRVFNCSQYISDNLVNFQQLFQLKKNLNPTKIIPKQKLLESVAL